MFLTYKRDTKHLHKPQREVCPGVYRSYTEDDLTALYLP